MANEAILQQKPPPHITRSDRTHQAAVGGVALSDTPYARYDTAEQREAAVKHGKSCLLTVSFFPNMSGITVMSEGWVSCSNTRRQFPLAKTRRTVCDKHRHYKQSQELTGYNSLLFVTLEKQHMRVAHKVKPS
jgi:hypothetical protein